MTRIFGILLLLNFQAKAQSIVVKTTTAKTVFVAEPSGNDTIDRESILSALKKANGGDTVQFSPGVYRVGKKIQISIDGITLKGDSSGTIIRGCNPEKFTEHLYGLLNCGGFELIGRGLTIEYFIFEYTWHGLMIGCCLPNDMEQMESGSNVQKEQFGGHLIRKNTFRFNSTGIRVIGINPNTVVIEENIFQDNYHGLTINGSNVRVTKNKFHSLNPKNIPIDEKIDNAIGILPFSSMFPPDNQTNLNQDCTEIIIEGNIIEKIPNDIRIADSTLCKDVVVKENIIKQ